MIYSCIDISCFNFHSKFTNEQVTLKSEINDYYHVIIKVLIPMYIMFLIFRLMVVLMT